MTENFNYATMMKNITIGDTYLDNNYKDIDKEIMNRIFITEESLQTLIEIANDVMADCRLTLKTIRYLKDLKNKQ